VVYALSNPLESFGFLASFLGVPFAATFGEGGTQAAVVLGCVMLLLYGAGCLHFLRAGGVELARSLPWISIGAYSILTAIMTTLGRVGMSEALHGAERYVTFSVWLGISNLALTAMILEPASETRKRSKTLTLSSVGGGLLAVLALGPWPASRHSMQDARARRLYGKACMQFADVVDDLPGLSVLYKRYMRLRDRILVLARAGLFSPGLVASPLAQEFEGDRSVMCGTFERLARSEAGLVASGQAQLPWRGESPDAILLAYDRPNEGSTIFAVCSVESTGGSTGDHGGVPWSAACSGALLPPNTASVSAWAFDALTGKAFRLTGSASVR
jgi:hypothetical protein